MVDALGLLKMGVPALFRGGSIVVQKVNRMRRIDEAIKGIADDSLVASAIHDFEVVKGSWIGEFTMTVDGFLRHFEKSGLVNTMMMEAIVAKESSVVGQSFVEMFVAQTGQDEENGRALCQQIRTSFSVSAKYLLKDPVLAEFIRASTDTILDAIARVERVFLELSSAFKNAPPEEFLADLLPRMTRSSVNEFKVIKVETSQGRKDVDINKIYIPPRLSLRTHDRIDTVRKLVLDSVEKNVAGATDFRMVDRSRKLVEALAQVNLDEISTASRVVILGDPGGGKSTLLQSICHSAAVASQTHTGRWRSFSGHVPDKGHS